MMCSCGNLQCYVCGQNIKDYRHFDAPGKDGKVCPLHENDDQRLQRKIQEAQKEAVKKVIEEGEGLNEEDVKVDLPKSGPVAPNILPPFPPGPGFVAHPPWNWHPLPLQVFNPGLGWVPVCPALYMI